MGRQQLKEKQALAFLDGSEKEEERDEERAALVGGGSEENGHQVPVRQESNVSLKGAEALPVSTPVAFTEAIPMLDMDSDTDVDGEEEGEECTVPVTLNTAQEADQPSNTAQFHMDSDTDVDEDHDAVDKALESVPSSENNKHFQAVSLIRPENISMDSDTDVDDGDDTALPGAAPREGPLPFQSTDTSVSAPSVQIKDFHLDSDTDVDEEEEKECAALPTCSKLDETPSGLEISPGGPESVPAAPPIPHTDSETDDEAFPAPAVSEPSAGFAVTESGSTAVTPADLDILSDSDTDVKDDSPLVVPFAVTALSFVPSAARSDSNADTDVDEASVPPAGDRVHKADPGEDSDTDVEEEVDFQATGEDQHLSLHRENTPGYLAPPLQKCSTPLQLPGKKSLNKNFIEQI